MPALAPLRRQRQPVQSTYGLSIQRQQGCNALSRLVQTIGNHDDTN